GLTGAEAALPAWTEFVKNAVELRPELGGEAFARPAGITFVEVDPETGLLATPSCPQHEQVAITAALAPNMECTMHTAPPELVASSEDSQTYDYEPAVIPEIREASGLSRPQPLPRLSIERIETPSMRTTRIETDTRGERSLVNEMRVSDRLVPAYGSRRQ
ncbi:MAG TPA: hypothetical protein VKB86_22395, partial [Pyrinomonadaceae bacterium]|nr:hypothetical protein [Pyrinomonadaceae bacterium]